MSTNATISLNNRNSLVRSIVLGGIIIGSLHLIIQDVVVSRGLSLVAQHVGG